MPEYPLSLSKGNPPAVTASAGKINLLDLDRRDLEAFFAELGEKPFRAVQIMKWIYHERVTDFVAMTNLSKALRQRLAGCAEIRPALG